jgi:quinol monooxygenase YgiN
MQTNLLTVIAEIVAKPGQEDRVRAALLELIDPTREEEGCVQYDLHVSDTEPGRFFFYENWTCREALDEHLQKPHLTKFIQSAEDMLSEPVRIVTCRRLA